MLKNVYVIELNTYVFIQYYLEYHIYVEVILKSQPVFPHAFLP